MPSWMKTAEQELARGVREIPGPEHEARILEYHSATSLKATSDEVPWCSSFVNWVMQQHGYEGTRSAAARSWLTWGLPSDRPQYGDIAVLRRGTSSWQGHVGFVSDLYSETVLLLGGNQANAVSLATYPQVRVLGYRRPRPLF